MNLLDVRNALPRHATNTWDTRNVTTTIVIHHTATSTAVTPEAIARYHVEQRDRPGICYHYVIAADGTVYWCNDDDALVWHAGCGYDHILNTNNTSIGIALVGNFMTQRPPGAQLRAARDLVTLLECRHGKLWIIGHKQAFDVATLCPGDTWDDWRDELREEDTFVSKLTWHIQDPRAGYWPSWLKGHVNDSGAGWVKIMDPDQTGSDPFPGVRCVGRLYFPNDCDHEYIPQGAQGAAQYVEACLPRVRAASWVHAWEGPNEPDTSSLDAVRQWAEFETARVRLMHQHGYRTVSGCFGTGRPEGDEAQVEAAWRIIGPAIVETDYLALHEYGMHAMAPPDGWHLLRYRRAVGYLQKHGWPVPPILITETGIDYAGDPNNDGWRKALNYDADEYYRQLAWYDSEICRDDIVQAAFVFTAAPHAGEWESFKLTQDISALLRDHLRANPPAQPQEPVVVIEPPSEEPTPYALTEADVQDARMTLATYPATMKACTDREYTWCAEWQAPDGGQCCLAWYDGSYRVIKLEPHTWTLVDEVIL